MLKLTIQQIHTGDNTHTLSLCRVWWEQGFPFLKFRLSFLSVLKPIPFYLWLFFFFFLGNIEDILRMILPLTCSAVAKKQFQDSANGRVLVDYTTLRESISTESKSLIFFFSTFCNAMMTICWHVCMMDTVFAVVLRTHFGRCSRCFDCLVSPCLSVLHNIFFFCFITGTFLFFDFLLATHIIE